MSRSVLIFFFLFLSSSYANMIEFDYCVADSALPHGPSGYACKDPTKATGNDFAFSGLRVPGTKSTTFHSGVSPAFVDQFPALNGMGISIIRADMAVGGAVPLHTHRASELVVVIEGTILAGFIDTNNKVYYKTLEKGDLFIVPPTLVHFQVNVGKIPSMVYASFNSANPGVQIVSNALFQSDLPTEIISRITLVDPAEIMKLKKIFGGSK